MKKKEDEKEPKQVPVRPNKKDAKGAKNGSCGFPRRGATVQKKKSKEGGERNGGQEGGAQRQKHEDRASLSRKFCGVSRILPKTKTRGGKKKSNKGRKKRGGGHGRPGTSIWRIRQIIVVKQIPIGGGPVFLGE